MFVMAVLQLEMDALAQGSEESLSNPSSPQRSLNRDEAAEWNHRLMKRGIGILLTLFVAMLAFPAWSQSSLPTGTRWLEHVNKELLPFWTTESAFGNPFGAFPGTRCNDATLYDARRPCPEIRRNPSISPQQRHVVAISRQAYGYGVAFHLTGKRAYLDAMKAGVDFIRQNAMDRVKGGMATTQNMSDGSWIPAPNFRNSQELAYGLLGMAFYYYLTRDADVLQDILAVKNYIFEKYYNPSLGAIQWMLMPRNGVSVDDKRLVAQLDQMSTYLVLLTPMLPEPLQSEWKTSLLRLCHVMVDQFYSPGERLFFLSGIHPKDKALAMAGTDFGHNAKALWMIRWTGLITANADLVAFAENNARVLFLRAYLEDCGCWADGIRRGGALDLDKSWWVFAELNQLAGTLALRDPAFVQYLPRTYEYWFQHFVDPVYGEVWNGVDGRTHAPLRQLPKQWQWKSAYHSFEHALVGYIVAQQLHGHLVTLYYAVPGDPPTASLQPYYFSATIHGIELATDDQGRQTQKITFSNVH
jgi:mannose/cellobiose epimerase-like protein (N-acyl-D-glucosamine 2-epimerase family)